MHSGNASPSEVFHRNLIDAVYNVEGKGRKMMMMIHCIKGNNM